MYQKGVVAKTSLWRVQPKICCCVYLPFKLDYVIEDAAVDASWIRVSAFKRKYMWILANTPTIPNALYKDIEKRAVESGFDRSRIRIVPQTDSDMNPEDDAEDSSESGELPV